MRRDSTTAYRLGLLRGLLSGERAPVGPFYVHVDVTHRCNLRCLCCRWHSPIIASRRDAGIDEDVSPALLDRLCDELRSMGTRMVFFVGTGEPLLHPDIFRLIESVKRRGLELVMYTNGLALNQETVERLLDSDLDVLRVSVWTPTEAGFEQHVGPGSAERFRQIVDGMRLFSRIKRQRGLERPLLELCQSVADQGKNDLDATVALAEDVGCDRLCFSPLVDFGERALDRFLPPPNTCRRIGASLEAFRHRIEALGIEHNIETMHLHYRTQGRFALRTPCYPAWFFSYVRSDGKVFLCQRNGPSTRSVGDLDRDSFSEIWNGDAYREVRRTAAMRGGPAASGQYFCEFCSHSCNTYKVHRFFRFLRPFERSLRALTG